MSKKTGMVLVPRSDLLKLLEYNTQEAAHYESCTKQERKNHIYNCIKKLREAVENQIATLYLAFVYGDVEPEVIGPFKTEKERDKKARALRRKEGVEYGIYMLTIKNGLPRMDAYSGGFFDEEYGSDAFEYPSIEEAWAAMRRLQREARKLTDGIERQFRVYLVFGEEVAR
jgi:hypothetical protein